MKYGRLGQASAHCEGERDERNDEDGAQNDPDRTHRAAGDADGTGGLAVLVREEAEFADGLQFRVRIMRRLAAHGEISVVRIGSGQDFDSIDRCVYGQRVDADRAGRDFETFDRFGTETPPSP